MRQQRGGEVQEEDCRGARWRRSVEEGEYTRLQKTDGWSEAFETRKWKTKAIWMVQAKGWGPRGLRAVVERRGGWGSHITAWEVALFISQTEERRKLQTVPFRRFRLSA